MAEPVRRPGPDIADGDLVRVHDEHGGILAIAKVTDGGTRGVVMAPMGTWRRA